MNDGEVGCGLHQLDGVALGAIEQAHFVDGREKSAGGPHLRMLLSRQDVGQCLVAPFGIVGAFEGEPHFLVAVLVKLEVDSLPAHVGPTRHVGASEHQHDLAVFDPVHHG